jgi:hypothetical protein
VKRFACSVLLVLCGCLTPNLSQRPSTAAPLKRDEAMAGGRSCPSWYSLEGASAVENDLVAIRDARFELHPLYGEHRVTLTWHFAAEMRGTFEPAHVSVWDVTSEPSLQLVDDAQPALRRGAWQQDSPPIELSRETAPWLYTDDLTKKVFQFVFDSAAEPRFELCQVVWFPKAQKRASRELVEKILSKPADH